MSKILHKCACGREELNYKFLMGWKRVTLEVDTKIELRPDLFAKHKYNAVTIFVCPDCDLIEEIKTTKKKEAPNGKH